MPGPAAEVPRIAMQWWGLGADEWAALGTWAAVIVALLASGAGGWSARKARRAQRRIYGPAVAIRTKRLEQKLVLLLSNTENYAREDVGVEPVKAIGVSLDELLEWPTVEDLDRLAGPLPEAASELALCREYLGLARETITTAVRRYGGAYDQLHRPRLVKDMRAHVEKALAKAERAGEAATPYPLRWRLREASWQLIPKRWRH